MVERTSYLPAVEKFQATRERVQSGQEEELDLSQAEGLDFPELSPYLERTKEISGTWNPIEFFTATNLAVEKAKFLAAVEAGQEPANPQFEYGKVTGLEMGASRAELEELQAGVRELVMKLRRGLGRNEAGGLVFATVQERLKYLGAMLTWLKIKDDLLTCEIVEGLQARDDERVGRAVSKKYGEVDAELAAVAERSLRERQGGGEKQADEGGGSGGTEMKQSGEGEKAAPLLNPEEQAWLLKQRFNAEQIKEVFEWALREYGLLAEKEGDFGFLVSIEGVGSIDVRDKNASGAPKIIIPTDRVVNGKQILQLLGHEIECHVRQSMNGVRLFKLGGGALKTDGEAPYEGLAKQADLRFEQEWFGGDLSTPEPYYIKAMEMARGGADFATMFRAMKEMLGKDSEFAQKAEGLNYWTWTKTYRIFRGSSDPENKSHYVMTKDKAYLEGYLIAEQMRELGYGEYNQLAITTGAGVKLLGLFGVREEAVPYPDLGLQRFYWEEVLRMRMRAEQEEGGSGG